MIAMLPKPARLQLRYNKRVWHNAQHYVRCADKPICCGPVHCVIPAMFVMQDMLQCQNSCSFFFNNFSKICYNALTQACRHANAHARTYAHPHVYTHVYTHVYARVCAHVSTHDRTHVYTRLDDHQDEVYVYGKSSVNFFAGACMRPVPSHTLPGQHSISADGPTAALA